MQIPKNKMKIPGEVGRISRRRITQLEHYEQRKAEKSEKRQSHLAVKEIFLDPKIPSPKPPSFLGIQHTSQLTRWSLLVSHSQPRPKEFPYNSLNSLGDHHWDAKEGEKI